MTIAKEKHSVPQSTPVPVSLRGVLVFCPETRRQTREFFARAARCPRTQTLVGENNKTGQMRFIPIRCKCWNCEHCAKVNCRQLEEKLADGKPSCMITLTTKLVQGETPQQAHDRHRPQISKMFASLRKKYGVIEYACVLETHKNGNPHWHILARCAFIPQVAIREEWEKRTGSYIVGIEKIRHQRKMGRYVTNYVLKEKHIATADRLGRIISFSKHYLSATRVTLSQEGWTWRRDKLQVEFALDSYSHILKSIEILPTGEVLATTVPTAKLPSPDAIMWSWANEEQIPTEDQAPWEANSPPEFVPF